MHPYLFICVLLFWKRQFLYECYKMYPIVYMSVWYIQNDVYFIGNLVSSAHLRARDYGDLVTMT